MNKPLLASENECINVDITVKYMLTDVYIAAFVVESAMKCICFWLFQNACMTTRWTG